MDPFIFAPVGGVVGGVGLKLLQNSLKKDIVAAKAEYTVTYYTSDGALETKQIAAARIVDGEPFDENGFRIGYDTHYTRSLEIEISGVGRTSCDCLTCEVAEAEERQRERDRQREIERIENKRKQAELARKKAEEREAAIAKLTAEFNDGKYDHLSVRQMMQQGISKDHIVKRLEGPIIWPECAISGTTTVTYERDNKVPDDIEKYVTKYYCVEKTIFPTGETNFKRVEIDEAEYNKNAIQYNQIRTGSISGKTIHSNYKMYRDEMMKALEDNRNRNNMYLAQLRSDHGNARRGA